MNLVSYPVRKLFSLLLIICFAALSSGCETEKLQQTEFVEQQNFFLQSLELVESAGILLQNPELTQQDIEQSMVKMDKGLAQAFKVKKDFLAKLDVRLPRFYNDIFIAGVESYRIGVESSNREKQMEGLNLLNQWGQFWAREQSNIQQKLVDMAKI